MFSWTRFLIFLALLLTLVGSMGGFLWANRRSSEEVLQWQARDGLIQLVRVTGDNVRAYLQTAVQIVRINRSLILSGQLEADNTSEVTLTFNTMLYAIDQLDGVLLAHPDGRFAYVRRDRTGRYIKVIDDISKQQSTVTLLNADNRMLSRTVAADRYDPRKRPWYMLAQQHPETPVWTAPYVFSSSQLPGVTVATALNNRRGETVIVGTDVQLSGLAHLLEHLTLTPGGRAFITDDKGYAIAASRAWPKAVKGRVPTLAEVGDPPLQALMQDNGLLKIGDTSEVTRRYRVGNEAYSAVLRRIEVQPGTYWMVGVYAPEADFVSDLSGVARQQLILIVTMTVLAVLIAWPLAFRATQPLTALHWQATTDSMTGLRNRASFMAQLSELLEHRPAQPSFRELAVALFDLDGFKFINDTHGHAAGDEVLQRMGTVLRTVQDEEMVARLGGDEFALLLHGAGREEIRARLERIFQTITTTSLEVAGGKTLLQATAGLAFAQAQPPGTPAQAASHLLASADAALILGKKRGKGRVWSLEEAQQDDTQAG
ncbi:diguanylate cyclase [Deinococcus sp. KNUC1210]|uniref:sensor domain-containing diguanylate cyclase n=1 Tax=Deinococcus sp. KNUC1210 TaxID=2917691 RepID=UPI001EF0B2F1|nr:sensor domain-containing diguanylate cyclase [Deinococcus sp. KNUC1210]ULH14380.1 diguanylate cyclase [Deinococcus sp. KNUC1210]